MYPGCKTEVQTTKLSLQGIKWNNQANACTDDRRKGYFGRDALANSINLACWMASLICSWLYQNLFVLMRIEKNMLWQRGDNRIKNVIYQAYLTLSAVMANFWSDKTIYQKGFSWKHAQMSPWSIRFQSPRLIIHLGAISWTIALCHTSEFGVSFWKAYTQLKNYFDWYIIKKTFNSVC